MKKTNNIRSCIVCKQQFHKSELIRLTVVNGNVVVDFTNRLPGKGYYIYPEKSVIEKILNDKNLIAKKVKAKVSKEFYEQIMKL